MTLSRRLPLAQPRLGLVAAGVALALSMGLEARADDEAQARSLVQLYYTLQGNPEQPDDVMQAGIELADELYDEGWSGAKLVDLVMRAQAEIPGAKTQPFEAVMAPYVRGHAALADAGIGAQKHTSAASLPPTAATQAPTPAWNSDLSEHARVGTDRLPPVASPQPALMVGGIIDMVGAIMYLVGALTIAEPGVPSGILMGVSTLFFSSGALIGNITMTIYQGVAVHRGAIPNHSFGVGAWILGSITLAATIGAFALGAEAENASSDDLLAMAIGSLLLTSTAFGCEIANLASVRSKWRHSIDAAPVSRARNRGLPRLRPMVFASRDPRTGSLVPMAGFAGTF